MFVKGCLNILFALARQHDCVMFFGLLHLCHVSLLARHHSTVCRIPSSGVTMGFHPSTSRALVQSSERRATAAAKLLSYTIRDGAWPADRFARSATSPTVTTCPDPILKTSK